MPVRFINIYLKITILKTFNNRTTTTTGMTKEERANTKKTYRSKQIKQKVLFT